MKDELPLLPTYHTANRREMVTRYDRNYKFATISSSINTSEERRQAMNEMYLAQETQISAVLSTIKTAREGDSKIDERLSELTLSTCLLNNQIKELMEISKHRPLPSTKIFTLNDGKEVKIIVRKDTSRYFKIESKQKLSPLKIGISLNRYHIM